MKMKLNANALGLAAAMAVAILWILCSLIVTLMPGMSLMMSGYMMHADFTGMQWDMHLAGFLGGLVSWGIFAYVFAWLIAVIYNRFA
jgi:membrane associated rhomboid family serine protease